MARLPLGLALAGVLSTPAALACTGGALTAQDGGVVVGRTLEFGQPLDSQIAVWPAGSSIEGSSNQGAGLRYVSRYGFLGATVADDAGMILDGLNEKGLNVGLFYFPGYAQYTPNQQASPSRTLAPGQLGTWILANFKSVDEVKAQINSVSVTPQVLGILGMVPDVHFKVQDASGKSVVIEPRGGRLVVHDNPMRVLTNAPTFDWQTTNLSNYLTLSSTYPKAKRIGDLTLQPFGMGAGAFGLPGDFSPPVALCAHQLLHRERRPDPQRQGRGLQPLSHLQQLRHPLRSRPTAGGHQRSRPRLHHLDGGLGLEEPAVQLEDLWRSAGEDPRPAPGPGGRREQAPLAADGTAAAHGGLTDDPDRAALVAA